MSDRALLVAFAAGLVLVVAGICLLLVQTLTGALIAFIGAVLAAAAGDAIEARDARGIERRRERQARRERLPSRSAFEHAESTPCWDLLEWPDIAVGERPMTDREMEKFHVERAAVFERVTESDIRAMGARALVPKGE